MGDKAVAVGIEISVCTAAFRRMGWGFHRFNLHRHSVVKRFIVVTSSLWRVGSAGLVAVGIVGVWVGFQHGVSTNSVPQSAQLLCGKYLKSRVLGVQTG